MSEYKVIQDIEAEDKLLGPLTLRQFIYASIVVAIGAIGFFFISNDVWFLAIPLIPPFIFFGLLAAPFGRDQSSEIWLLGKVRYMIFSKKRIWDQEGIEHLVTITVPKKVEKHYSDGLSGSEVKSRLKTLANTMDTRGWIVKNVTPGNRSFVNQDNPDRLLEIQKTPEDEALATIKPASDVLNTSVVNPIAANLSSMVDEAELQHRQELLANMRDIADQYNNAPAKPPAKITTARPSPIITPTAKLPKNTPITQPKPAMTPPPNPVIIDGVNKRKLSSEIDIKQKSEESDGNSNEEVVISLH